jgi:hypothetical protein
MDLQQEYFARHGFDLQAVCYPDNKGSYSIVLMNKDARRLKQPRFVVVNMQLHKQENHPSFYKFTQMTPLHDSFGNGAAGVLRNAWDKKVYYDEWDAFIRRWTDSNKGELVPISGEELVLAAMEMFLYSHDSWLAQNLGDRQKDNLFVVLDDTLPVAERLSVVSEIEESIRAKSKNVYSALTGLRAYGEGRFYAGWVKKLL